MELLRKISEWLILGGDEDEELDREEIKKAEAPPKATEKASEPMMSATTPTTGAKTGESADNAMTGAPISSGTGAGYGSAMKFNPETSLPMPPIRPTLTVVESKMKDLNVKIYNPTKYEEASKIAADILSRNAAVVNYDYVEASLQLRICDFLNGVCYVTDGYTDKISEKIFLYVPDGVDTVDIAEAVASGNNNRRNLFAS